MQATVASPQALAGQLQAFLNHVHHHTMAGWLQIVADLDLSLTQIKALHVLSEREELSVKDVGEALALSLPAASRAIDGLVGRGLVERRECAADRRSRLIRLSDAGREVSERAISSRLEGLEAFVDTLTPEERNNLHNVLVPILERTRG
jgi:DNA-binding MarR family transcriptional regulator